MIRTLAALFIALLVVAGFAGTQFAFSPPDARRILPPYVPSAAHAPRPVLAEWEPPVRTMLIPGRITDQHGAPWRGKARIRSGNGRLEAQSAADGRFEMRLSDGEHRIVLEQDDPALRCAVVYVLVRAEEGRMFAFEERGAIRDTLDDLVLRVVPAYPIRGRVVTFEPALPVRLDVRAEMDYGYGDRPRLRLDFDRAHGTFVVPGLPEGGAYRIIATVDTKVVASASFVRAGATDVVVEIVRKGEIRGRVVDREGRPVAGVSIRATARDAPSGTPATHGYGYTDSGGRFVVEDVGPYTFVVEPLPYGPTRHTSVRPLVTRWSDDATLEIAPAVSIRGRLLESDGTPVTQGRLFVPDRGDARNSGPGRNGRFELAPLPGGRHRVVYAFGGPEIELGEVEAPAEDVELRLPAR